MGSSSSLGIAENRNVIVVLFVSVVLISSVIAVDIGLGGHEYQMAKPTLDSAIPNTLYFYNISEGVTGNTHSIIIDLPTNHSGSSHIIPREVSIIFWFKDLTDGSSLFPFVNAVWDTITNCTLSLRLHDYDDIQQENESGWYAPSSLTFAFNDIPNVDIVRLGVGLEIVFANYYGNGFDGHVLSCQIAMNVTYSRLWNSFCVSESHQINSYHFNATQDGLIMIESLEYGFPHYP